jgi:hypothetical protein
MTASAGWFDFATMIGGASGALTGLLFVAVSLNASRIAGHAGLRASAEAAGQRKRRGCRPAVRVGRAGVLDCG